MKKITYLLVLFLSVFFTLSCEKDFETPPEKQDFREVLQKISIFSVDTVILLKSKENNLWEELTWTAAKYIEDLSIRYTIQIDKIGNHFATPVSIEAGNSLTKKITVKELNTVLLSAGYLPVVFYDLEIRIKAFVHKDLDVLYSKTIANYKVKTFLDIPSPSELFIFGSAIDGTEHTIAENSLSTDGSDYVYSKFLYLEKDNSFCLTSAKDDEGYKYNFGKFNEVTDNISNDGTENNYFKFTGKSGWYKVEADFNTSKLSVVKYVSDGNVFTYDYPSIYLVGDYGGETWSPSTAPKFNRESEGIFTIKISIKDGATLKFIGQQSWDGIDWGDISKEGKSGIIAPKGENNNITFDGAGKVYKITINLKLGTYVFDLVAVYPENLFMIGNGVGGWGWSTVNLPLVRVNSHENLYWTIVWMEATGEYKFAPQRKWGGDFGKNGDAEDGVYSKGSDNIPVPGVAGYYLVVVGL